VIPPGVPSSLLERRPDIAATERRVASANAQIGIAVAAFFPDLTLSASVAFSGFDLGKLLQVSNEVWSVGPQLAQTVFDGGLRSARVEQARAFYDQTIATYRQTVLTGFQQVEDQLAALRILAQQAEVEDAAVRSAREAERLVLNQYRAGTVPYTSVITAQATALGNEESALSILQNRLIASISLIEALGGGWNAGELPNVQQVKDGAPPESRRAETRDAVPSP
jgi:NodT family efflux transporter outer membrane factor (OMF) lipoprotein